MKRLIVCAALSFAMTFAVANVLIGKLNLGNKGELPLELTLDESSGVTLCSPAQSRMQIPAKVLFRAPDSLSLSFFTLGAKLQLKQDNNGRFTGLFTQRGSVYPITFGPKAIKPMAPKPYVEKELKVINGDVVLSGTLTLPENFNRSTPVAVMVTGSGKQNRDEELFQHKPFADIADYLGRTGVATYRYDDRGSYMSTAGRPEDETTIGYATDAIAAVKAIREEGITDGPIGIIGHSEGGTIAWMVPETDFVVALAAPTVRGDSILLYQVKENADVTEVEMQARQKILSAIVNDIELNEQFVHDVNPDSITEASILAQQINASPWLKQFIKYSPAADIKALSQRKIPVLALYFSLDKQVPPSMNIPPLRASANNFIILEIEGVNHILVECTDGSPLYYPTLPGPTSPKVLRAIGDFILQLL